MMKTQWRPPPRSTFARVWFVGAALVFVSLLSRLGSPMLPERHSAGASWLGIIHAADGSDSRPEFDPNPPLKNQCKRQMTRIGQILRGYERRNDQFPDRLSDLGRYFPDEDALNCPFAKSDGVYREWRQGLRWDVFSDDLTTYAYEFINVPMGSLQQGFGLAVTVRDYKQRQQNALRSTDPDMVPIIRCFAHDRVLNLTPTGRIYESETHWEDELKGGVGHMDLTEDVLFAREIADAVARVQPTPLAINTNIPPRDAHAGKHCLDLSKYYNALLTETWHGDNAGNDLSELGSGLLHLDGVEWDVRGVLQLRSTEVRAKFPYAVTAIPADMKCRIIRFLHGTSYSTARGFVIGTYTIHYDDGSSRPIPIKYAIDVEDWWYDPTESFATTNRVAWSGDNKATRDGARKLRIYHMIWTNPLPDRVVTRLDVRSSLSRAAPFLLAITLE